MAYQKHWLELDEVHLERSQNKNDCVAFDLKVNFINKTQGILMNQLLLGIVCNSGFTIERGWYVLQEKILGEYQLHTFASSLLVSFSERREEMRRMQLRESPCHSDDINSNWLSGMWFRLSQSHDHMLIRPIWHGWGGRGVGGGYGCLTSLSHCKISDWAQKHRSLQDGRDKNFCHNQTF